jgi:Family of unknown function (DUF6599)
MIRAVGPIMRILRLFILWFLLIATALVASGYGQEKVTHLASPPPANTAKSANSNILPDSFGGWKLSLPAKFSKDAGAADPTDAPLLKEYGFTDFEGATYTRDDGRKLTIKAARFEDASGAYGAFTFYKTPVMINEKIGDQGYSLNNRVLFFRGNILVDALFQQLSAMSAAELRELSGELPRPRGTTANPPSLPAYLPTEHYLKNTARYVLGPIALEKVESPLPAQFVDFGRGAEVQLGDYNLSGTPATLMLINYPTPQIAADQLKNIEAAQQANQLGNSQISARRTGPILAIVSGAVSNGDAKSFLGQINYDADVTWNQNTYFTRRDNVANLIVGVIILAAIICGMAVVVGLAFGGFRVLMKRLFPDKVFDRPEQVEIIALHLSDPVRKPGDSA